MTSRMRSSGSLFEFLEEAELQQHFSGLKNILQVHTVQQLKYVHVEDLYSIGMSKPEARRLKTFYSKAGSQFGSTYASKLKRLLLPSSKTAKRDFLLGPDGDDVQLRRGPAAAGGRAMSLTSVDGAGLSLRGRHVSMSGDVRVQNQHIIPSEAIAVYKELGAGEFGVVQQGVWTDDDQLRHQVAVKCLSKDRINNTLEFMKEYDIMHSLDHPNIVRVFGVVLNAPQIMLITELAPLRSLLECLKEPSLRTTFTVSCLSSFAVQICQGMSYLESKRLIHRDLAARNILVFSKDSVKISDFGLSRALGVGKDYYKTNFNVNLKLPIAWCAPESINFLRFTSASDVWAFGVTLWEMYSYGFQPWAAQTGQQILEAIDEPNCQRLEQPLHCPREHYAIMLQCWRHDPTKRPVFEALVAMLEEAKPEQVKVVVAVSKAANALNRDRLEFDVGDIITVLDKHSNLWSGAASSGKVGLFCPSHTVAYVSTLPTQQGHQGRWQTEDASPFQRGSLRGSRGSKKKLSRDMISGPRGDVHHTAHVGLDGAFFGDVTGFSVGEGAFRDSTHLPSLSRADSDASERAPLISARGGSTSSAGNGNAVVQTNAGDHANKNPRMGYAIGYLRNASGSTQPQQSIDVCQKEEFYAPGHPDPLSQNQQKVRPHEYQTIVDEDFGHLDLGPSMMDEVFAELQSANEDEEEEEQKKSESKRAHHFHDIKDLVSSTLTLSSRRHGKPKKQQATVKPIKASDEKTLEEAIAMANALASKSMHELDKRCLDRGFDSPPPISTPTSPSKRSFHFRFPTVGGGRSSPRAAHRHFSDETNASGRADIESLLTPGERDAYRVLIEGRSAEDCAWSPPSPPNNNNPLPLPPKSERLKLEQPPKRHVRRNPLIIPSGMAANVLRRENIEGTEHFDLQMSDPTPSLAYSACALNSAVETEASESVSSAARAKHVLTASLRSGTGAPPRTKGTDDAFENAIAYSMDALDNIPDDDGLAAYESPKQSSLMLSRANDEESLPLVMYDQDRASCEDITDLNQKRNKQAKNKARGAASDEVRIMRKVLGNLDLDTKDCVDALDLTDWNVHHAIKLLKIKTLLHSPKLSDTDLKVALQMRDWDVARAANVLMKKIKE